MLRAHNYKEVPVRKKIRRLIRKEAEGWVNTKNLVHILSEEELAQAAAEILTKINQPLSYQGYTMVEINNAINTVRFGCVPFEKRLLLLPHCLRDEKCKGRYDDVQLKCVRTPSCKYCAINFLKKEAQKLGYAVLVAEGSPIVMRMLVEKRLDGVLGIACLDVLEKAFSRIVKADIPSYAIPLLKSGCKNTDVDIEFVLSALKLRTTGFYEYIPAMKKIMQSIFNDVFAQIEPYLQQNQISNIARSYIALGGKRLRPFLTVVTYSALTDTNELPEYVLKTALAIEIFHKASLVHDDIEDGTAKRYEAPTLHQRYGSAVAINIGDYLIGMGYRLLADVCSVIDKEYSNRIFDIVTNAHIDLTTGQDKELRWRDTDKKITVKEVLEIYRLKTSSAFKCATMTGAILGGFEYGYDVIAGYGEHLGIAYQILNDIYDVTSSDTSTDILTAKPTLLYAIAYKKATYKDKRKLAVIYSKSKRSYKDIEQVKQLYAKYNVLKIAYQIAQNHYAGAADCLTNLKHKRLKTVLLETSNYIFKKW
jgi:geranylgeranyl pyrophosphate synthase